MDSTLMARPVPALTILFNPVAQGVVLYPAPLEAFAPWLGNPRRLKAFRGESGNLLIGFGREAWYALAVEDRQAYRLPERDFKGRDWTKFTTTFPHELSGRQPAIFEVDEAEGLARLTQSGVSTELEKLPEAEETDLRASITEGQVAFISLPGRRRIALAAQLPNRQFLVLSRDEGDNRPHVFMGPSYAGMRELEITATRSFRGAIGTTYGTPEGALYLKPDGQYWQGKDTAERTKLDPLDPAIVTLGFGSADTRIAGIKTWAEYARPTGPA